ncbi:MAG: holo-[acyl-carrier-protein] synthase [Alphaproteobacteria bacterium]|nr:holo-[acyl-carrier-protein] synthase [Alphaproteobacteria bacterium]
MIVGIGTDVVNIGRIERTAERYGKRFCEKIFTKEEQKDIAEAKTNCCGSPAKMAKLFAAKEAASKALGTGFRGGIVWSDIEVSHDKQGRPLLKFYNKALMRINELCGNGEYAAWLSLSDDYPIAQAVVVIEKL